MTFEQAKAKADALTAAGGIWFVEKDSRRPGGYGTRDFCKRSVVWRTHNAERAATGYWSRYGANNRARIAGNSRAYRARRKAYFEALFAQASRHEEGAPPPRAKRITASSPDTTQVGPTGHSPTATETTNEQTQKHQSSHYAETETTAM
jgi:hypothetical protein